MEAQQKSSRRAAKERDSSRDAQQDGSRWAGGGVVTCRSLTTSKSSCSVTVPFPSSSYRLKMSPTRASCPSAHVPKALWHGRGSVGRLVGGRKAVERQWNDLGKAVKAQGKGRDKVKERQ